MVWLGVVQWLELVLRCVRVACVMGSGAYGAYGLLEL